MLLKKIEEKSPLIHAITNPISINQCANTILAVGARPVMAEHPGEVRKITEGAQALLLNLGNITDVRKRSMVISGKAAKKNNIPVVLDVVGAGCSKLRRRLARRLIKHASPTIIKGNYSEIKALYSKSYSCSGVDADKELALAELDTICMELAARLKTTVLASGQTDIISDGEKIIHIEVGTAQLSKITGTGCMLGALCACFVTACDANEAAALACRLLGKCGELSASDKGAGSFSLNLMNYLSNGGEKIAEI